jgi:hypothetical protein
MEDNDTSDNNLPPEEPENQSETTESDNDENNVIEIKGSSRGAIYTSKIFGPPNRWTKFGKTWNDLESHTFDVPEWVYEPDPRKNTYKPNGKIPSDNDTYEELVSDLIAIIVKLLKDLGKKS